jgi:heat shock protein HslJ
MDRKETQMNQQKKSIAIFVILTLALTSLLAACSSSGGSDNYHENNWKLVSIDGEAAIPGVTVTALFDGNGGLTGSGGCNDYTGNYGVGGDQLQINAIRTTTNQCDQPIMEQENAFIDHLNKASSFEEGDNPDIATIVDIDGREVMTMERFTP